MPDKKGKLSSNVMAKNLYYEKFPTTKKKKNKKSKIFLNPNLLAELKLKQIKDKKIEKERGDSITQAFLEKVRKFKKGGKLKGGNRDMFSEQYD